MGVRRSAEGAFPFVLCLCGMQVRIRTVNKREKESPSLKRSILVQQCFSTWRYCVHAVNAGHPTERSCSTSVNRVTG